MKISSKQLRFAVGALLAAAALWAATRYADLDPAAIERQVSGLGMWAPAGFIAAYALATVLFLPGALFGLAGGTLCGPPVAATYGCCAAAWRSATGAGRSSIGPA